MIRKKKGFRVRRGKGIMKAIYAAYYYNGERNSEIRKEALLSDCRQGLDCILFYFPYKVRKGREIGRMQMP